MKIVIYLLSGLSILLALGGFEAYRQSRDPGLLISSIVSVVFSLTAITLVEWWPLFVGFGINVLLKVMGFDRGSR
jgi:hypothetical protein